jgi:hypothetical protein
VTFQSNAPNLVSGDTNNQLDVFVWDRATGATTLVSRDSAGTNRGNRDSYNASISADGNYVTFQSGTSNLVTGDTNNPTDVFVWNRATGTTTLVSRASAGTNGGNRNSYNASISADGNYVTFLSDASNLVTGDTNNQLDVFVWNRATGTTTLVSRDSAGTNGGNSFSYNASISADGNYVTFQSDASNLVTGDTNNQQDVFVWNRATGTTTLVSRDSTGTNGGNRNSYNASISANGNYVTFESEASNFVSGDYNQQSDIFGFQISANRAPTLIGNAILTAVNENTNQPTGATITSLFAAATFTDPDSGSSLAGLAIVTNTANTATEGAWQYSTNSGTNWYAIGTVADDTTALALATTTQLRFVPITNYKGTPTGLTVRAIDNTQTSFTNGATRVTINAATNGGTSAIASATNTITQTFTLNVTAQKSASEVFLSNPNSGEVRVTGLDRDQMPISAVAQMADGTVVSPSSDWKLISSKSDFNRDGVRDLVWFNTVTTESAIWYMQKGNTGLSNIIGSNSSMVYAPKASAAMRVGLNWQLSAVGNLIGDDRPEFLWEDRVTGESAIWQLDIGSNGRADINLSTSGFITSNNVLLKTVGAASGWKIIGIGNFDNDTTTKDVLWFNEKTSETAVWQLNGTAIKSSGYLNYKSETLRPGGWKPMAIGNIDGLGSDEIVWQNGTSVAVWNLGSNFGVTDRSVVLSQRLLAGEQVQDLVDLNLDGTLDLVARRQDSTKAYYMNAVDFQVLK